ncbi:MAG: glycosyltransferase family 39 protein [Chthoniobacterales bacterium]
MKFLLFGLLCLLTLVRIWFLTVIAITPGEAYHWMCANQLDLAYFDGPGGTAALVAIGQNFLGATPLGIRIAFPLAAFAASIAMYLLGRNCFGTPVGLLAAALLNALPLFNLESVHASPTIPALASAIFAAVAAWRAIERKRDILSWVVTGLWIAVGTQFHYSVVLLWLSILIICLSAPRYRPQLRHFGFYVATLLTVVACLPGLMWNSQHDWAAFSTGTLQTVISFDPSTWHYAFANVHAVLSMFGGLFLLAAFFVGFRTIRRHLRPRFAVGFATPFLLVWLFFALHGERDPADLLIAASLTIPFAASLAFVDRSIFRIILPPALLLTAITSAIALAFPHWHPQPASAADASLPWRQVATAADSLRTEAESVQPAAVFFIAKNPAYTAALNFHLPRVARNTTSEVFLRESQDLATQFGIWPRYDDFVEADEAPDEFFTELRATNPYEGRSAIYITDETELPQTIQGAFRLVSLAGTMNVDGPGDSSRILRFYFCEDYQTMTL